MSQRLDLQSIIIELLRGIDDPGIRMEVMRTINYLSMVYGSGQASDEEIYSDIVDVVFTVLATKHPDKSDEELRGEAEAIAKRILMAIKLESMLRRTIAARTGGRPPV